MKVETLPVSANVSRMFERGGDITKQRQSMVFTKESDSHSFTIPLEGHCDAVVGIGAGIKQPVDIINLNPPAALVKRFEEEEGMHAAGAGFDLLQPH